jgi:hypothetical protein
METPERKAPTETSAVTTSRESSPRIPLWARAAERCDGLGEQALPSRLMLHRYRPRAELRPDGLRPTRFESPANNVGPAAKLG